MCPKPASRKNAKAAKPAKTTACSWRSRRPVRALAGRRSRPRLHVPFVQLDASRAAGDVRVAFGKAPRVLECLGFVDREATGAVGEFPLQVNLPLGNHPIQVVDVRGSGRLELLGVKDGLNRGEVLHSRCSVMMVDTIFPRRLVRVRVVKRLSEISVYTVGRIRASGPHRDHQEEIL
jgi:hypothetical protein